MEKKLTIALSEYEELKDKVRTLEHERKRLIDNGDIVVEKVTKYVTVFYTELESAESKHVMTKEELEELKNKGIDEIIGLVNKQSNSLMDAYERNLKLNRSFWKRLCFLFKGDI